MRFPQKKFKFVKTKYYEEMLTDFFFNFSLVVESLLFTIQYSPKT